MELSRRRLLRGLGATLMGSALTSAEEANSRAQSDALTLFLCGDVMTGRGIDQVLPHPGDPVLYERWMKDARRYVELAEGAHGPIQRPVSMSYIWGAAAQTMAAADVRVINLETAITQKGNPAAKGIHYRMHPKNIGCITVAGVDCCVLANNHVLDWGPSGLVETLRVLDEAGVKTAGAGRSEAEATAPALCDSTKGRVVVFGCGMVDSGIPRAWRASSRQPGVCVLDRGGVDLARIAARVRDSRKRNDVVVASIHWGGNWGYRIPPEHRELAHRMVDEADVDVVHGHSSHHPKGIEVYRGRLILYGCGDFINDYEGIGGYERYRPDLALAYMVCQKPATRQLLGVRIEVFQMNRFRLRNASKGDAEWLREQLEREGGPLGTGADLDTDSSIALRW